MKHTQGSAPAGVHRVMIEFASDPTLTIYPAAQSECAQVLIPGQRYRVTVATRYYADSRWHRYTGTREPGAPLTSAELDALSKAPRQYLCG